MSVNYVIHVASCVAIVLAAMSVTVWMAMRRWRMVDASQLVSALCYNFVDDCVYG